MNQESNRRTIDRVQIPHGSVYYKPEIHLNILNRYSGPEFLSDISKSGAGFIVSHALSKNDYIRVKFNIPGEKSIVLHGHVRWVSSEAIFGKNRIGMQFSPYGYKSKYNAIYKLERLGSLGEKYQQC